jgi:hypothetical protein
MAYLIDTSNGNEVSTRVRQEEPEHICGDAEEQLFGSKNDSFYRGDVCFVHVYQPQYARGTLEGVFYKY